MPFCSFVVSPPLDEHQEKFQAKGFQIGSGEEELDGLPNVFMGVQEGNKYARVVQKDHSLHNIFDSFQVITSTVCGSDEVVFRSEKLPNMFLQYKTSEVILGDTLEEDSCWKAKETPECPNPQIAIIPKRFPSLRVKKCPDTDKIKVLLNDCSSEEEEEVICWWDFRLTVHGQFIIVCFTHCQEIPRFQWGEN